MKPTLDLAAFETLEQATLTVQSPKGGDLLNDGQPVQITLYGAGSKQHVAAKHKLDNATQVRSVAMLRGKVAQNSIQDADRDQVEYLAACTVEVINFPIDGGARALYANPKLGYIRQQVEAFLNETENFMPD